MKKKRKHNNYGVRRFKEYHIMLRQQYNESRKAKLLKHGFYILIYRYKDDKDSNGRYLLHGYLHRKVKQGDAIQRKYDYATYCGYVKYSEVYDYLYKEYLFMCESFESNDNDHTHKEQQ